jgi:hypothetical protein
MIQRPPDTEAKPKAPLRSPRRPESSPRGPGPKTRLTSKRPQKRGKDRQKKQKAKRNEKKEINPRMPSLSGKEDPESLRNHEKTPKIIPEDPIRI